MGHGFPQQGDFIHAGLGEHAFGPLGHNAARAQKYGQQQHVLAINGAVLVYIGRARLGGAVVVEDFHQIIHVNQAVHVHIAVTIRMVSRSEARVCRQRACDKNQR